MQQGPHGWQEGRGQNGAAVPAPGVLTPPLDVGIASPVLWARKPTHRSAELPEVTWLVAGGCLLTPGLSDSAATPWRRVSPLAGR